MAIDNWRKMHAESYTRLGTGAPASNYNETLSAFANYDTPPHTTCLTQSVIYCTPYPFHPTVGWLAFRGVNIEYGWGGVVRK